MKPLNEQFMNDPNTDTIDLEYKNINDLKPQLGFLSKFKNLDNLILKNNKLTSLPEKMNTLSISKLDVSDNAFEDLEQTCEVLGAMPNLKSLLIDIKDDEEVDVVLKHLPNLEFLNLESIRELDTQLENNSVSDVDFEMQSTDLQNISALQDQLREQLTLQNVGDNEENVKDFENLTEKISEELKEVMNSGVDVNSRRGCIAKNKFLMYSLCLEKLLDLTRKNDTLDGIADTVFDNLKNEFIKLLSLFQEMVDSDQQNRVQTLQLENDELRTELEMAQREIALLKKHKHKDSGDAHSPSPQKGAGRPDASPRLQRHKDKDEQIGTVNPRTLSIKQLKDMLADILKKKEIHDEKCEDTKVPKESMEQFMYNYFNKRFGLKKLIVEYSTSVINGIRKYASVDNDIAQFGKVLQNKVDENQKQYLSEVKSAIKTNLKKITLEKNKSKSAKEINEIQESKLKGSLNELEQEPIVRMMQKQDEYFDDAGKILDKITALIQQEAGTRTLSAFSAQASAKLTRRDEDSLKRREFSARTAKEISFERFTKVILDFALVNQEKFLQKLKKYFDRVDSDLDGVLNEAEFVQMLKDVQLVECDTDENLAIILHKADPNNTKTFGFSDVVLVFTETEVEVEEDHDGVQKISTINVIEKINKFNK